jgi:hypothetical protein
MLIPLLLGTLILVANMGVQVMAVVLLISFFSKRLDDGRFKLGTRNEFITLCMVLAVLFAGHIVQFASWAFVFIYINEFNDFETAFYHSTVNFAALGYGDIVMSERWRLLGAIEAANGVLMFGLTTGTILSVMNRIFSDHKEKFLSK